MKKTIYSNPQDPFLEKEMQEVFKSFFKIKYKGDIPTVNPDRTFFWSTELFSNIRSQYFINLNGNIKKNNLKYFFILPPKSYEQRQNDYNRKFRNRIKKALGNNLIPNLLENPKKEDIKSCYNIYLESCKEKNTFFFPYTLFKKWLKMSNSHLFVVRKEGVIITFVLTFGNLMYISSSNNDGKEYSANNLIYDYIYKYFENEKVFIGTSIKDSGAYKFKDYSGAIPYPVELKGNGCFMKFLFTFLNKSKKFNYFTLYKIIDKYLINKGYTSVVRFFLPY